MAGFIMNFVASSLAVAALLGLGSEVATAFAPHPHCASRRAPPPRRPPRARHGGGRTPAAWARRMSDQPPDDDGADLAAQFFQSVQGRNIEIDLDAAEEEEEEEEEADAEAAAEAAAEDAVVASAEGVGLGAGADADDDDDDALLREYDVAPEGSLSDDQIYKEMKDRVLSSAGAFVELTRGADDGGGGAEGGASAAYAPPAAFPDSGLTAGEVVELVLAALRNNDVPRPDYGVEVLFGYSSPDSQIAEQIASDGLTPAQYRAFLRFSEDNAALFDHAAAAIDKADFSPDGRKGYFTARLTGPGGSPRDDVAVNFIVSTPGTNDDDCWLIDSMLIRPPKLRRRRR